MHSLRQLRSNSQSVYDLSICTGDMVGLVARFRNEAIYGEDVEALKAVRAHLKLFDRNGKEIGIGVSSAQPGQRSAAHAG